MMKKSLFLVLVLFLFACSNGDKTSVDSEDDSNKTDVANNETTKVIEIIGTGFTAEFPSDYDYKQSINSVSNDSESNFIFMYAPATPLPDSETVAYFVEGGYQITVSEITDKEYFGYDGYFIEGAADGSNIKKIIIIFGTNEFVGLISIDYYIASKEKVEEIISSVKFDENKINTEANNVNDIDLSISNFKFSNNTSGLYTYSENGDIEDAMGLTNCFSYLVVNESVDTKKYVGTLENSLSSYLFPTEIIDEGLVSFNGHSGDYKIYNASLMGIGETRIHLYVVEKNNVSVMFIASSIENHDHYQEIFRKTVESISL